MTYCVGLKLNRGLVFISDTLTNAGIDNINTNKKMFNWHEDNEKCIVLLTSGNLATSQATINLINEGIQDHENNENNENNILNCLLYTSPSPRDKRQSRMPSSA